jgi:uncharacterized protein (TIGR03435 family)
VATLLLRLVTGLVRAQRLVNGAVLHDGRLTSSACAAPVTVGWFRPRVILPAAWPNWAQGKLEAVLIHEGEHARRRDPLLQGLSLLNRAVFWFHPAAWWLDCHLSALAEQACDDVVLSRGFCANDYSEYLIDMARSVTRAGARVNLTGVAMPGSSLPRRILRIMEQAPVVRVSRTRMTLAAFLCAFSCAAFAASTLDHARPSVLMMTSEQVAAGTPALTAESLVIRTSTEKTAPRGEGIVWKNATLGLLLVSAYQLPESQFVGLPDWADSEYFDVVNSAKTKLDGEYTVFLTQSLLADRFRLAMHDETRQLPYYELVMVAPGKLGPNLHVPMYECDSDAPMGTPASMACGSVSLRRTERTLIYTVNSLTIQQLLSTVAGFGSNEKLDPWGYNRNIDRPVIDHTGLTSKFDLTLEFAPDWPGFEKASGPAAPLSLSKALEDQLGLRLVPRTGPVGIVVVDHVEMPTMDQTPQVGAPSASAPQPFVESIIFEGNRRISSQELASRIFTRPGDPYYDQGLRHDSMALWNSKLFENVDLEVQDSSEHANSKIVIFHLRERPTISFLDYRGIKSVSKSDILDRFRREQLDLVVESLVDRTKVRRAETVIQELLAERGHPNAVVKGGVETIPATNSVRLIFNVDEGATADSPRN